MEIIYIYIKTLAIYMRKTHAVKVSQKYTKRTVTITFFFFKTCMASKHQVDREASSNLPGTLVPCHIVHYF